MKLYKELACTIDLLNTRAKVPHLVDLLPQTKEQLFFLLDHLPHGSGIDANWVASEKLVNGKFFLFNSFHMMDEFGMYDGWIDFTVIVAPDLQNEITVTVKGKFPRKDGGMTIDYLTEILDEALRRMV